MQTMASGTSPAQVIHAVCSQASAHERAAARLSARDREVLTFLTWGLTNQQVADELDVSVTTVKTYVRIAYLHIGVACRTQAVVWGVRNGLAGAAVRATVLTPWERS